MPARRSAAAAVRPLETQIQDLSPSSPSKRKNAPAHEASPPSTPSPQKKRLVDDTPVGSAVLKAMASLTAGDPLPSPSTRPSCVKVPMAKAAAALAAKKPATSSKKLSLTRVTVKTEPVKKVLQHFPPVVRSSTPISLSSDDDDNEFPPVSGLLAKQSLFIDDQAIEDAPGVTTLDDDDLSDLADFIVPDSSDFEESAHSDASNLARKQRIDSHGKDARQNEPVHARRISRKLVDDDLDDDAINELQTVVPGAGPRGEGVNSTVVDLPAPYDFVDATGNDNGPTAHDDHDGIELASKPVMDIALQDPRLRASYVNGEGHCRFGKCAVCTSLYTTRDVFLLRPFGATHL
ncbi:hypothetical protein DXG01_005546 [Tephrocybe rancida]|nr:hypothetical protein DXG01_005546 [Tephrocybe rancida]